MKPLAAIVLVALLAAGCTQAGKAPASATDPTESLGLVPTNGDDAAFEGFVYGPDVLPIANVTIRASGANDSTVFSDATGYYAFYPVPAGAYRFEINETRFQPLVRNVSVAPGETRRLDFTLRDVPPPVAYKDEGYTRRATLYCMARANATGTQTNPSCTDVAKDRTQDYLPPATGPNVTMGPGVEGIMIEVEWIPSVPVVDAKMRLAIRPTAAETWRQVEGASVLRAVIQKQDLAQIKQQFQKDYAGVGGQMFFELYPGEAAAAPGQGGAGGTVYQDYTMYVTIFYRMPVPAGYSRLNE